MNDEYLDKLINSHLDDALTPAEQAEFEAHLRESEAARQRFWELAEVHGLAGDAARIAWADDNVRDASSVPLHDSSSVSARLRHGPLERILFSPLGAAVAGLVIGVLSTTVIWAATASGRQELITLLHDSFESGQATLAENLPLLPGRWSGDYSEVTGAIQEVTPEGGSHMLRFLRADHEGLHLPESFSSDVFRLIDVRQHHQAFADSEAVVQLTARFNAAAFPDDENYTCTLTIFALDESLIGNELLRGSNMISAESLAYSRSSKLPMDRDAATWQKLSNELRIPPETQYLMIRLGCSNDTKTPGKRRDSFAGHFADSVELVFANRPEIATR